MGIFKAKQEIGPDTVLQRRKDLLFNEVDGEIIILSIDNGKYIGLNKIGSRIWALLENSTTIETLINKLIKEYHVSAENCFNDIKSFINQLLNYKLIDIQ
jgi:hypothetical protein